MHGGPAGPDLFRPYCGHAMLTANLNLLNEQFPSHGPSPRKTLQHSLRGTSPHQQPNRAPAQTRTTQHFRQDRHVGQPLQAQVREALAAVAARIIGPGLGAQLPCDQVAVAVPPANHAAQRRGQQHRSGVRAGCRWWRRQRRQMLWAAAIALYKALSRLASACTCQ